MINLNFKQKLKGQICNLAKTKILLVVCEVYNLFGAC